MTQIIYQRRDLTTASFPGRGPVTFSRPIHVRARASTFLRARYVSRVSIPPNGSVADWDQVDTGSVADLQLRVCCTVIVGHHKLRKVLRAPELCAPPFANTHDDLH